MATRSSGATVTSGAIAGRPSSESNATTPSGSGAVVLRSSRWVPATVTPARHSPCPASRSSRSPSATNTVGVQSSIAKASSAPVQKALRATATAPEYAAAKNATDHSGTLRRAMATRSPGRTPRSCTKAWARRRARSRCSVWDRRSSPSTRNGRSPPRSAPVSSSSHTVTGALRHARVGRPSRSIVVISNRSPGPVSRRSISRTDGGASDDGAMGPPGGRRSA